LTEDELMSIPMTGGALEANRSNPNVDSFFRTTRRIDAAPTPNTGFQSIFSTTKNHFVI
jgi:hypothetical protein